MPLWISSRILPSLRSSWKASPKVCCDSAEVDADTVNRPPTAIDQTAGSAFMPFVSLDASTDL